MSSIIATPTETVAPESVANIATTAETVAIEPMQTEVPNDSDDDSDDDDLETEDENEPAPVPVLKTATPKTTLGVQKRFRKRKILGVEANISKSGLRKLARRGGVKRVSGAVYPVARDALLDFLTGCIEKSALYAGHRRAKTITFQDVMYGIKAHTGKTVYS